MNEHFRKRDGKRTEGAGVTVARSDAESNSGVGPPVAKARPLDRWIAAAIIFLAVTSFVAVTANDLGVTWDEPPYRASQSVMAQWFRALWSCHSLEQARPLLTKEAILRGWWYNRYGPNFHPPLAGVLCNLTNAVFSPIMGDLPSRRLASGIELALAATVLFLLLSGRYGLWVGSVAAGSLVLMPRVMGDAHIAGTDMPLLAFWAFTALAFWNGLESATWRVLFGVLFGLSLLVKFTALLIIAPLALWLLCYRIIFAWGMQRASAAIAGTLLVSWPLGLAGFEIIRLAHGIQLVTQQERMLGPVIEGIGRRALQDNVAHPPPLSMNELTEAARSLRASADDPNSGRIHALIYGAIAESIDQRNEQSALDGERLQGILREVREGVLLKYFHHAPPFSAPDLKQVALDLLGEVAAKQGTTLEDRVGHAAPFSAGELKHVAGQLDVAPLALDQHVAYVMPRGDLGVSTRVPGWILFVPLLMWLLWNAFCYLPFLPAGFRAADGGLGLWLAGLAIAPAVAIAFNPTWWHETLPQLAHYYQISVGRQGSLPDIEIFYLGKKYIYSLPWHNGWVLMAVTVPVAILAVALAGLGSALWNWRRDPLRMFFVMQMLTLPLSRMLPTPAHDGVRLMLPTFFFLAGLAGWGFELLQQLVERFRSEEYSTAPVLGVATAFLLGPPAYWLLRTHPHELSYYNGLVAGLAGAQRAGFEPTYWYDAVTPQVVRELNDAGRGLPANAFLTLPEPRSIVNATLPPNSYRSDLLRRLPEQRINPTVFEELWNTRQLRKDIRIPDVPGVSPELSDFPYVALLTHSSKASPFTRLLYAFKPKAAWDHDGVRLFSLYDPPGVARAWALWLLVDATDYSRPTITPRVDSTLIELARRDYHAIHAAALRVTEVGLQKAAEAEDDPAALQVVHKLASQRELLELLLNRRKEALIEAAEILSRTAEKRPELLERLIESYDGYLPASDLGKYLDD